MQVATTILEQLGGNKFIAMTGSKNFVADGPALRMNLIRNKAKAKYLRIELTPADTYKMIFMNAAGVAVVEKDGVYHDMLQDCFTTVTGLDTSL